MEKLNSFYGLAKNDYLYAKAGLEVCKSLGSYNPIVSNWAQAGEKFLKAIIEVTFVDDADCIQLLHSHNLRALYNKIKTKYTLSVNSRDCKWLGDFYFDAGYPGDNFIVASKEDAEECLELVEKLMNDCKRILEEENSKRDAMTEVLEGMKAFD